MRTAAPDATLYELRVSWLAGAEIPCDAEPVGTADGLPVGLPTLGDVVIAQNSADLSDWQEFEDEYRVLPHQTGGYRAVAMIAALRNANARRVSQRPTHLYYPHPVPPALAQQLGVQA